MTAEPDDGSRHVSSTEKRLRSLVVACRNCAILFELSKAIFNQMSGFIQLLAKVRRVVLPPSPPSPTPLTRYRRTMTIPCLSTVLRQLRGFHQSLSVFQYSGRAVQLVWTTDHLLTISLAILTILTGLLPGAIAYLGKLIVDGVVQAAQSGLATDRWRTFQYVGLEAVAIVLQSGCQQGMLLCQALLKPLLAHTIGLLILEKALTLEMSHFEDAEFYDKMTRAREGAAYRPLTETRNRG